MRLARSVLADHCGTDPKCYTIPEPSQRAPQHIKKFASCPRGPPHHHVVSLLKAFLYLAEVYTPGVAPKMAVVHNAAIAQFTHCVRGVVHGFV